MNVLVTGNLGYIGVVLTAMLKEKSHRVTGFDVDYYSATELEPFAAVDHQIIKDIRDMDASDVQGMDAVIHLAGLSNDPLGEFDPELTEEINFKGTMNLANLAKESGVSRFVYASTQSIYGISQVDDELDEDTSKKDPLTAYAKTKWEAECRLRDLSEDSFVVVSFRPSTVFGVAPRLRCDIVYNNLVACAYTTQRIEIKSDGTPWRPVVHVRDVSQAFMAGLEAPASLVSGEAFNVGIPNGNFSVRDLAEAAQGVRPGCELVFTGEHGSDARSYRVSFKKILGQLKDYFKPEWNLRRGGLELIEFFERVGLTEEMFRGKRCNRLAQLKYLIEQQSMDNHLRKTSL